MQTRESREGQENELETLATKLADLHVPWELVSPIGATVWGVSISGGTQNGWVYFMDFHGTSEAKMITGGNSHGLETSK